MLYKGIYLVVNNLATYLYYYLSKTGKHRLILRQKWCTLCNTSMKGNTYSQKKLLDNHSYKFKSTSLLSSISNLNSNHCTKWICWMTIREGTRRDHFARGGGTVAESLNRPSKNPENCVTVMYCTSIESLTCPKVDFNNLKHSCPFLIAWFLIL